MIFINDLNIKSLETGFWQKLHLFNQYGIPPINLETTSSEAIIYLYPIFRKIFALRRNISNYPGDLRD